MYIIKSVSVYICVGIVLINILVLQFGPSNKNLWLRLISPHFYVEIVYVSRFIV